MVKIAIVGASENLGREILDVFSEHDIPLDDIYALEPQSPMGTMISYGEDEDLDVFNLDDFDFSKVDVVLITSTNEIAKRYMPKILSKGVQIIDCSGASADNPDVPMVISDLNDEILNQGTKNVVSVPSALVTQVLKPLSKVYAKYGIKRIMLTAYLSTSFHSREAMDELFNQTRQIYMNAPIIEQESLFQKQIAFNVLPQVGQFIGEETEAEWRINAEIKKTTHADIKVHANLAYVPSFIGAGIFANVETERGFDLDDVRSLIQSVKGVTLFDKQVDGGYVSLNDIQGQSDIFISRLRQDLSTDNGFSFWSTADNLRADLAQNAFDILMTLLKNRSK